MIKSIHLRNFKCFDTLDLSATDLTLFTGLNAAGKSTVMQALLLIHQTLHENEWASEILLNGDAVCLGALGDVVDQVQGGREFGIGLTWYDTEYRWTFKNEDRHGLTVPLKHAARETHTSQEWCDGAGPFRWLLPYDPEMPDEVSEPTRCLANMIYVGAERSGPRETYPLEAQHQAFYVGSNGEFAPGLVYRNRDQEVHPALQLPDTPPTLIRQIEGWLGIFFPGTSISIQPVPNANLVTLGIRTRNDTEYHRPQNVGHGITQLFPILTACLIAQRGSVLVLDGPEVHLHPRAQAAIARLIALTASVGVQVFVESHSDHVLNGIRRAVREGTLDNHKTTIHFFAAEPGIDGPLRPKIDTPVLSADGSIDRWPKGFFDQLEEDTAFLAGWSG